MLICYYVVKTYVFLLPAEGVAECLVSGRAHPVLLAVKSPKTYRIACVDHIRLTETGLLVIRNLVHILLNDVAVEVGEILALSLCDILGSHIGP